MERKERAATPATQSAPEGYDPPRVEATKSGDDLGREALMAVVSA